MVVLNAPGFFSFSWAIIRRILDPRTAAKIKIFSDEAKGLACLFDKVEKDQVIADYGGAGPSFDEVMQAEGNGTNTTPAKRREVKLLSVLPNSKEDTVFELSADETAELDVFTRSIFGCHIKVLKDDDVVKEMDVQREATPEEVDDVDLSDIEPYRAKIISGLKDTGEYKVVVETKPPAKANGHFLLIGEVR